MELNKAGAHRVADDGGVVALGALAAQRARVLAGAGLNASYPSPKFCCKSESGWAVLSFTQQASGQVQTTGQGSPQ